ncbi:hypothetical protein [Clostridium chromiireducens]|uniref:Uncharacterized protein n=1 Tax=Clostridium chromiireducens TaxID=225345 RepID=A0A1V4I5X9_9CLOT|nr:hypothetical protein [Clostridium chromiireducens]OPJ55025.1 hypothetical protein CLCHR_47410 [Clostridium chromiireducens]
MVRNEIKTSSEERNVFDKKQIALAIRNSTFDDELRCSLLNDGILNKCEGCSLKYIFDGIDEVVDDYAKKTTEVINSFLVLIKKNKCKKRSKA